MLLNDFQFERFPLISLTRNPFHLSFPTNFDFLSSEISSSDDFQPFVSLLLDFLVLQRFLRNVPILFLIHLLFPVSETLKRISYFAESADESFGFSFQTCRSLFPLSKPSACCPLGKSLNFTGYERISFPIPNFFFGNLTGLLTLDVQAFSKFSFILCKIPLDFLSGSEYRLFRFSETSEDLLQAVESRFCCAFTDSIESGLSLEPFVVPYLRRFSFCDYTISRPLGGVHSQSGQRNKELFVHIQTGKYIDGCGIMNLFGVSKNPPPRVLGGGFVVGSLLFTSFRER